MRTSVMKGRLHRGSQVRNTYMCTSNVFFSLLTLLHTRELCVQLVTERLAQIFFWHNWGNFRLTRLRVTVDELAQQWTVRRAGMTVYGRSIWCHSCNGGDVSIQTFCIIWQLFCSWFVKVAYYVSGSYVEEEILACAISCNSIFWANTCTGRIFHF